MKWNEAMKHLENRFVDIRWGSLLVSIRFTSTKWTLWGDKLASWFGTFTNQTPRRFILQRVIHQTLSYLESNVAHTHTHTPGPLYIHETHDLWSLVSHQRLQKQLLHLQPGNLIWIDTDTKSSHVFNTKLLRCVPFLEVKVGSRHTLIACLILSDPTRTFSRNVVTKGSNFFQVACKMSMRSDWQVKLYIYVNKNIWN